MICDLHSPDTFDTRLGERASANVQPCEAVSLSGSIGSQKAPLKREVELEEETTRKFSKSCDEARIPETKAMTFNQCTFIISKD